MIFPIFDKKSQKNTTIPYRTQKGTFRDPKKRHFLKKVISGGGGVGHIFFFAPETLFEVYIGYPTSGDILRYMCLPVPNLRTPA